MPNPRRWILMIGKQSDVWIVRVYKVMRRNLQPTKPETPGQTPSLTISVLGSFTCSTQHTGPTALRPIRRTKQLCVLRKDTSVATWNRTHILVFWQHLNLSPVQFSSVFNLKFSVNKSIRTSWDIGLWSATPVLPINELSRENFNDISKCSNKYTGTS